MNRATSGTRLTGGDWAGMDDELIAHMRGRVKQMYKLRALAHDPRMIDIIQRVIDEGEADIARLEADRGADPSNPS